MRFGPHLVCPYADFERRKALCFYALLTEWPSAQTSHFVRTWPSLGLYFRQLCDVLQPLQC